MISLNETDLPLYPQIMEDLGKALYTVWAESFQLIGAYAEARNCLSNWPMKSIRSWRKSFWDTVLAGNSALKPSGTSLSRSKKHKHRSYL